MKKYPLEGRIFLPPDCETIPALALKLVNYYEENALATHHGQAFVDKQLIKADKVLLTLKELGFLKDEASDSENSGS